jgi:hypothetical protein
MYRILLLTILLLIISCKTKKVEEFNFGNYVSNNGGSITLNNENQYSIHLMGGNTHARYFKGFSEGSFTKKNNILIFNSNRKTDWIFSESEVIQLDILESKKNNDSLNFKINNFSEVNKKFNNELSAKLFITIDRNYESEIIKKIKSNETYISYKDEFFIADFNLVLEYNNKKMIVVFYGSKFESDFFQFELPDLSPKDFKYIYLKDDYLLFEKNTIYWNGIEFNKVE